MKQIKSAEILANASVELEEELDNVLVEELEEFNANEESKQELQTQKNNILDDPEESLVNRKSGMSAYYRWTVDPNSNQERYQNSPSKRICL